MGDKSSDGFKIITGVLESAKAYLILISPLKTGNPTFDACVMITIPFILPVLYRIGDDGLQSVWKQVLYIYNGRYVTRTVSSSRRVSYDHGPMGPEIRSDRNEIMQKAIALYLVGSIDLKDQKEGEVICIAPQRKHDPTRSISIIDQLRSIKITVFPRQNQWANIIGTEVGFRQIKEEKVESSKRSHEDDILTSTKMKSYEFRALNPGGIQKIDKVLDVSDDMCNF